MSNDTEALTYPDLDVREKRSLISKLFPVLTPVAVNFLVGFVFHKARVFEPRVIQDQLLFVDFTMLEFFLAGAGATAFFAGVSTAIKGFWGDKFRYAEKNVKNRQKERGLFSVMIGSILVGIGMSVSGACPGTLYCQMGSGVSGWYYILAGAITGTFTYLMMEKHISTFLHAWRVQYPEKYFPISFSKIAVLASTIFLTASTLLNIYAPKSSGITNADSNIFTLGAWPPVVAGVLFGVLQIPVVLSSGSPMGMSSTVLGLFAPFSKLLVKARLLSPDSTINKWTLLNSFGKVAGVLTMIAGAYVSSVLSDTFATVPGLISDISVPHHPYVVSVAEAGFQGFFGGFLLLFGARLADGCTSGHGLSGFPFMGINSIVAVPFIFAGGIGAMQFMKAIAEIKY
ncbi:hypothetical protein HK098_002366 [Nowakowskiella sp. JEL0407]|nr:hypothetical protein HK098_002366 [Nowakowskiella sp. JEL0407]